MARKRRSKRADPRAVRRPAIGPNPGWRWRTMPVWVALWGGFVAGWYVAAIGAGRNPAPWATFALYGALLFLAFGLSRITTWLTERWLARRQARKAAAQAATRPSKGPPAPA